MRSLAITVFAVGFLTAHLALADWDPEARRHIEEEANLNDQRGHALDPIIARNIQSQHEMMADANELANQARAMRDRSNWYRSWAARPGVWHREHFERQANELMQYADHNEQLAATERGIAQNIEQMIQSLNATRTWHFEVARRMRESLAWR